MKQRTVWLIIVLMSVALIGLTSFQVYWINNAIQLNKKTFKENVLSSLNQVASNLERYEIAAMASANVTSFYSRVENNYKYIYREEGVNSNGQKYILYDHDSVPITDKRKIIHSLKTPRPAKDAAKLKHKDSPFSIEVLNDSTGSLVRDSSNRVLSKVEMVNVVLNQLTTRKAAIHRDIDIDLIDSLLNKSLIGKGIGISYELAIWNAAKDSIVESNSLNTEELKTSELKAALFPNDLFNSTNYLLINFPTEASFLYKQIWTTLAASILFILIIVSCFSYAIHIIFKQKKLSEMKNDFINNMTHELKTPIATVSLAVEALNEKEMRSSEPTLLRYLGMIREENMRLSEHVEKVLQSALLDKESFELKQENLNFHDLINSAVGKSEMQLIDQNGSIKLNLKAPNDHIKGDKFHLINVILNIIDNAIKYSPEPPSIHIATYNDSSSVVIEIRDEGIGMSTEATKHIFDKFYRVHTGNRHDVKGFGLGLSYVKTMVDKHGGSITVQSKIGEGSTFMISIPNE